MACGAVALSFLVSLYAIVQAHGAPRPRPGGDALDVGLPAPFQVDWAYLVDPLSSVMLLVVTFVGFLIHVYSIGYMAHDPGLRPLLRYLNLFMFAMLILVLGANYAVLFVGWEGVGLCSYLLIGFWFDRSRAPPTPARRRSSSTGSATPASSSACSSSSRPSAAWTSGR